jgi:hypothetical protein
LRCNAQPVAVCKVKAKVKVKGLNSTIHMLLSQHQILRSLLSAKSIDDKPISHDFNQLPSLQIERYRPSQTYRTKEGSQELTVHTFLCSTRRSWATINPQLDNCLDKYGHKVIASCSGRHCTPKEYYIISVSHSVDRVPYMIYIHEITSSLPTNVGSEKKKKGFFEFPPSRSGIHSRRGFALFIDLITGPS